MRHLVPVTSLLAAAGALILGPPAARADVPPDVSIANSVNDPGPVVAPRDTFPVVLTEQVAGIGVAYGSATFAGVVPAGYRLIIEHISIHGRTPVGQRLWGIMHPCDNLKGSPWGTTGIATSALVEDSANTNALHEGIASTALYVDPGCVTTVSLQRNASAGGFSAWVTLHGHLAPLPGAAR